MAIILLGALLIWFGRTFGGIMNFCDELGNPDNPDIGVQSIMSGSIFMILIYVVCWAVSASKRPCQKEQALRPSAAPAPAPFLLQEDRKNGKTVLLKKLFLGTAIFAAAFGIALLIQLAYDRYAMQADEFQPLTAYLNVCWVVAISCLLIWAVPTSAALWKSPYRFNVYAVALYPVTLGIVIVLYRLGLSVDSVVLLLVGGFLLGALALSFWYHQQAQAAPPADMHRSAQDN